MNENSNDDKAWPLSNESVASTMLYKQHLDSDRLVSVRVWDSGVVEVRTRRTVVEPWGLVKRLKEQT